MSVSHFDLKHSAVVLCMVCSLFTRAEANPLNPISFGQSNLFPQSIKLERKETTFENLFPKTELPVTCVPPVPLSGINIAGLTQKSVEALGFQYFVVVNSQHSATMAEIYRENRMRGKTNFVTADSIIHSYFSLTNRVLADMIDQHLSIKMTELFTAMLSVCQSDYRQAQDAEVRDDIEHNMAFLGVALKLLNPGRELPLPPRAARWTTDDTSHIMAAEAGNSSVFQGPVDFTLFSPAGWYNRRPSLQNFYRLKQWLSIASYPVVDVSQGHGNTFRRSVLLYRCLDLAQVDHRPAYDLWLNLKRACLLLGPSSSDKTALFPEQYRALFKNVSADLTPTLNRLAEPFYRTKLLLSLRRKASVSLGSLSVFDLDAESSDSVPAIFRLFPPPAEPEIAWLKAASALVTTGDTTSVPIALLTLSKWGAPQASNLLHDSSYRLAPDILTLAPYLSHIQPCEDRLRNILYQYFTPYPPVAQSALRTDLWLDRSLESAFAGWIDSQLCMETNSTAPDAADGRSTPSPQTTLPARVKPANFHYLEPRPNLFKKMREDAESTLRVLSELSYLPANAEGPLSDFIRLSQRLENMALRELKGQPLAVSDTILLGNIDLVLEKVSTPVANTYTVQASRNSKCATAHSITFGLGQPGTLFIILQKGNRTFLARGALYTYYEVPGGPITANHWQRKLHYGLVQPPNWASAFDLLQDPKAVQAAERNRTVHKKGRALENNFTLPQYIQQRSFY